MIRVVTALVLLPIVAITVWVLPALATLVLAELVLLLAVAEYVRLSAGLGARPPAVLTGVAAAATCAAVGWPEAPVEAVLMAAVVVSGAVALGAGRGGSAVLQDASAAAFAPLYLGLPLGALAALRATHGAGPVLLLLATVMISDTAQYYGGLAYGRRPLAPAISPKKTIEGALTGFIGGTATMVIIGRWWLPEAPLLARGLLGAAVVVLGIAGDLFESALKRGAGAKDASTLIPGHGGMLDRIDSLLFAAPVYYVFVRYGL